MDADVGGLLAHVLLALFVNVGAKIFQCGWFVNARAVSSICISSTFPL